MTKRTTQEIKRANERYHDVAAGSYDEKWGISYGRTGQAQVVGKVRRALGGRPETFDRGLEIGAGTGYFSLNLLRARPFVESSGCTGVSAALAKR
jgi:hypothetical protein